MYQKNIQSSIPEFINETVSQIKSFTEDEWNKKENPNKWSKKEILGHLIDSGQNNIRRLIVSQYQQNNKIVYEQNAWVKYSDYQNRDSHDLIYFWKLINLHFHHISLTIPNESLLNTCDTGKEKQSLVSLEFLINDYWGHQQHHLRQILE